MKCVGASLLFSFSILVSLPLFADDECAGLPAHYGCRATDERKKICDNAYWFPVGKIAPTLRKWDKLIGKLPGGKSDVSQSELKKFKKDHGLPIQVSTLDNPEAYPNRVDGDEVTPGMQPSIIFLKKLVLNENKKSFWVFAEIEDSKKEKRIRTWKAFYDLVPVAIQGDELIFEYEFKQICSSTSGDYKTGIAVRPDGNYDLIDLSNIPKAGFHTPTECPVKFDCKFDDCLPNCSKLIDLKTKKPRYIRYEIYST